MNDPRQRRSGPLAHYSGDQLAVAAMGAALALLILLLAGALLT